eukprot:778736-Prorocentrum_minimum.AAC.11
MGFRVLGFRVLGIVGRTIACDLTEGLGGDCLQGLGLRILGSYGITVLGFWGCTNDCDLTKGLGGDGV